MPFCLNALSYTKPIFIGVVFYLMQLNPYWIMIGLLPKSKVFLMFHSRCWKSGPVGPMVPRSVLQTPTAKVLVLARRIGSKTWRVYSSRSTCCQRPTSCECRPRPGVPRPEVPEHLTGTVFRICFILFRKVHRCIRNNQNDSVLVDMKRRLAYGPPYLSHLMKCQKAYLWAAWSMEHC